MNNRIFALVLAPIVIGIVAAGCEDNAPSAYSNHSDPLGPRYEATLSDGITFSSPGYPTFVTSVKGISVREGFGRWTDDTEAVVEFGQNLPKTFTLRVSATMYQPSMGAPIKIAIGGKQYDANFPKQWDFKEVAIPVVTDGTARSVTFLLPNAKAPKHIGQGDDSRKLCLALSSMKIVEQ